ncbi:MAG: hypothetical protein ABJ242_08275 [Marinomonas sp.]
MLRYTVLTLALPALALTGCGPQTPEDIRAASIAKCERQFGQMAPDPEKGAAFCGCLTDKLADQGLEITDMLGSGREKVMSAARSCGAANGIAMPER